MAVDQFGLPVGPFTVGTGADWLPFYNAQQANLNNLYQTQGQLGSNLLGSVLKLASDPAAGPLGLTAFGHFGGGGQAVSQGTGGQGVQTPYSGLLDSLLKGLSQSVMNPGSPFNPANNGQYNPGAAKMIDPLSPPSMTPTDAGKAPNLAEDWLRAYQAYHPSGHSGGIGTAESTTPAPPKMKEGGMVFGGEKHYVVNESGQKVAEITEDGKPEHVGGFGGVEITPLDPARRREYEDAKSHGSTLGDLTGKMLTGGSALFPQYPGLGSGVNSDASKTPGGGTTMIPTTGGPSVSRADQVAATNPFKSTYNAQTGAFSMPAEAMDATTKNNPAAFAKMLGGALSAGNMAVPIEALGRLNQGLAPDQFLSSQALGSMLPSQRSQYFSLLQQMGLGSPEDVQDTINRGRPAAV